MCGIAGLIRYKGDVKKNIMKMNEIMHHRGPDGTGVYITDDGNVALGHKRLSILDLSENGSQPMTSISGRLVMVYNGEIYNHQEIKDKLIRDGGVNCFRGTSDSEVLLEAIERYGIKNTLNLCKGMFGLAVYDKKTKELFLARDRIGEKPLYYGIVSGSFVFASDIRAIREIDGFCNDINTDVLDVYFAEGYIPAPYSIYKGIYKLDAGMILTVNVGDLSTCRDKYYSIEEVAQKGQAHQFKGTREEAADELERLLKKSIKLQMVADVPVGAFLSAGIDSSTIVALMQELSPGNVRTFTIGMEDNTYDEAIIAADIAKYLGTIHTEKYISEKDAQAVIPKLPSIFGEPFADSSQIPTYLVSEMTRKHVTVSLSGDAGDELFGGYRSYESVEKFWKKVYHIPYVARKKLSGLLLVMPFSCQEKYRRRALLLGANNPSDIHRLEHETDCYTRRILRKHNVIPYKYLEMTGHDFNEAYHDCMLMDMLMYHPDDILVKVDRSAMAVSLETRIPMLDKDVIEFAWSLPTDYLRQDGCGKQVLRDVLYRYIPKTMMDRPKKGFSIPIDKWLLEPQLRQWAENLLERSKLNSQGILDINTVDSIWSDFVERGVYRRQLWYILMFQQWYENEYITK